MTSVRTEHRRNGRRGLAQGHPGFARDTPHLFCGVLGFPLALVTAAKRAVIQYMGAVHILANYVCGRSLRRSQMPTNMRTTAMSARGLVASRVAPHPQGILVFTVIFALVSMATEGLQQCGSGEFVIGGECRPCQRGFYCDGSAMIACPMGEFSAVPGTTACRVIASCLRDPSGGATVTIVAGDRFADSVCAPCSSLLNCNTCAVMVLTTAAPTAAGSTSTADLSTADPEQTAVPEAADPTPTPDPMPQADQTPTADEVLVTGGVRRRSSDSIAASQIALMDAGVGNNRRFFYWRLTELLLLPEEASPAELARGFVTTDFQYYVIEWLTEDNKGQFKDMVRDWPL